MKINSSFRFIIVLSAILIFSVGSVFAQEIDLDGMSDEQLMILLVQITDRLGLEMPQPIVSAEETPEPAGTLYTAAVPETTAEPEYFESWMNKKLVVDKLPEWYFYTAPDSQDHSEDDDPSSSNHGGGKKTVEECENYCVYEVCPWADLSCYWPCYYSCLGEPLPDWAK